MSALFDLTGREALVTGSSRGIDNALARALADARATVVLQFNSWILGRTPAHRWGTVQDLAGPAVWLASSGSDFVNGLTFSIGGGMTVAV